MEEIIIKTKSAVENFINAEKNAVRYSPKSDINKVFKEGIELLKQSLRRCKNGR